MDYDNEKYGTKLRNDFIKKQKDNFGLYLYNEFSNSKAFSTLTDMDYYFFVRDNDTKNTAINNIMDGVVEECKQCKGWVTQEDIANICLYYETNFVKACEKLKPVFNLQHDQRFDEKGKPIKNNGSLATDLIKKGVALHFSGYIMLAVIVFIVLILL